MKKEWQEFRKKYQNSVRKTRNSKKNHQDSYQLSVCATLHRFGISESPTEITPEIYPKKRSSKVGPYLKGHETFRVCKVTHSPRRFRGQSFETTMTSVDGPMGVWEVIFGSNGHHFKKQDPIQKNKAVVLRGQTPKAIPSVGVTKHLRINGSKVPY